jgi:hypothetical protein
MCRDILGSTSSRGLELLGCLQDSLSDPHPAVAALALEGLDSLLADDDLDFYKTWPLVARLLNPKRMLAAVGVYEDLLPLQPTPGVDAGEQQQQQQQAWYRLSGGAAAASALHHSAVGWGVARWVALLRHGAMDAETQPELATGVVRLLWMATAASEAQVRCLELWGGGGTYAAHAYQVHSVQCIQMCLWRCKQCTPPLLLVLW